jgi:hypothetical protein
MPPPPPTIDAEQTMRTDATPPIMDGPRPRLMLLKAQTSNSNLRDPSPPGNHSISRLARAFELMEWR